MVENANAKAEADRRARDVGRAGMRGRQPNLCDNLRES
jgi:hypothetical protein